MNSKKLISLMLVITIIFSMCTITVISFSASTSTDTYIIGDADEDKSITINDATKIQMSLASISKLSDIGKLSADCNQDGSVTIIDASLIQQYLSNLVKDTAIGRIIIPTETSTETSTEAPTETPTEESTQVSEDAWKSNVGTIVLSNNGITVTGTGASVSGNIVTITEGGDWEVTGTCDNGMIYVDTGEVKDVNDKVKLRLKGMSLTNKNGPAIYFDRCKKAFITIESDTTNTLCDGSTYDNKYIEAKATLHSDDSLEIKGKGTLNVTSLYKHAINSDDDVVIENGIFNIKSLVDGIHANDYITINGKNIVLNINSTADGIESEGDITISEATLKLTSTGKGIKSTNDLNVLSGNITITSKDDSIHSNNNVTISNGSITTTSDDDGIHADTNIQIDGGTINVLKSYEGIEANSIIINDGTISVSASDDGMNAAGGSDSSSIGGRPGQNNFNPSSSNSEITFNGGYVFVVASGDGIDANGKINFNGGTIISQGPTNGGNNCIDADSTITYTGGTVIGIASSQAMWSDCTGKISGAIYNTSIGNVSTNSSIAVVDSSNNLLSIIKPKITGNLGMIYVTDKTQNLSTCHFVLNGTFSGSYDDFGYSDTGTISGGTSVNPSTGGGGGGRPGRP